VPNHLIQEKEGELVFARIHKHTHTHLHTYTRTQIHIHTHTHTHIHTHTHTCATVRLLMGGDVYIYASE
jgi:hypothetical protein